MSGQSFSKAVFITWAVVVTVGLSVASPAIAQTWDGGGADDNWTTANNWNPNAAPANDGTANTIFAGTVRLNPQVNVAQDILGLTFDNTASQFNIGGAGPLTIRSVGITNNDTESQGIQVPIILQAAQTWNAASGILGFSGSTTTTGFPLTIDGGFGTSIFGVISGSGSLTKNGGGQLTFFNANTYTGGTTINAGSIQTNGSNFLPNTGSVTLNGSGVLTIGGSTDTMGALISSSATTTVSLFSPGSSFTVGNGGGSSTFDGQIIGASTATLTKTGAGTLTLGGGSSSFPGTYRITQGVLQTAVSERLDNAADLVLDGGYLSLSGAITETVDNVTVRNGSGLIGFSGTLIGNSYNFEAGFINSHLAGSATLTKTTAGESGMLNTHTYTGGTVIDGGLFRISESNALPNTGPVAVNTGGTLELFSGITSIIGALAGSGNINLAGPGSILTVGNNNGDSTFFGVISGGGTLNKFGTGALALYGPHTYTGGTVVSGGVVVLGAANAMPDIGILSVNAPGTFNLNGLVESVGGLDGNGNITLGAGNLTIGGGNATATFSGLISGTGNLIKSGSGMQTFSGSNTYTGITTVSEGTLRLGTANERLADASDLTVSGGTFGLQSFNETLDVVTLNAGSITGTGTLTGSAYNVESGTISAILAGAANLTKTTAGTVTLAAANTYTGTTQMFDGTLALGANNVFPDAAMVIVSGGTLNLAGFSDTIGTLGGPGNVTLGSGTLTVGGNNFSSVFAGTIGGSGNLSKIGSGTFSLAGSNVHTGTTTVNGGTLELFGAGERLADGSDLSVSSGTFDLHEFNETVDIVTLTSGSIIGTGTLVANVLNLQSGTISAVLGGPVALNKTTAGTVTLSGANTYSGGTLLDDGVISVGSDGNLGAAGGGLTFDGGTLRTTNSFTIGRAITLNAGGGTIDTVATTTFIGAIFGTGGLTKTGLGTLIVNTVSPQLSALTLSAGDLQLPVGGTLNVTNAVSIAAAGFMSLDGALINAGSIGNSGEIELFAGARLVGPVSNSGVIGGDGRISGALTNSSTGDIRIGSNESLHVASTAAHSNAGVVEVIAGELELDGPFSNAASDGLIFARDALLRFDGGLTNAGSVALSFGITDLFGDIDNQAAGDIVVSGASDATFIDDVVNDGDLRVSAGSVAVFFGAVSGGGSFPGTGLVFFEGDLRPGASPALIDFGGGVVFGSPALAEIEIGGTTPGTDYDKLAIAGDVTLDGTLTVSLINGFVPDSFEQFTLMTYASRTGSFATENLPALPDHRVTLTYGATSLVLAFLRPGDTNCSNAIDPADIPSFVQALLDPAGYSANFPSCNVFVADMNGDGRVDGLDVHPFVNQLLAQ